MSSPSVELRTLLDNAVRDGVSPGAVLEAGRSAGVTLRVTCGRLTYEDGASPATEETIYDLASLTKVIVTTSIAMRQAEARPMLLARHLADLLPEWRGSDRTGVTVRDLLEHCAGLPAWMPLSLNHAGRAAYRRAIAALPLEYTPWTRSIYSDLGFMLLGFILEDLGDRSLDEQFAAFGLGGLRFRPEPSLLPSIAPTREDSARGRLLVGEADDDNAWALAGVAGHAGLFGSAPAVGAFARLVLQTYEQETVLGRPDTLRRFATRSTVPRSSRALGWDTMLPTSSCGTLLSPMAIGHTGFTGTSLWIDPQQNLYVVLLTNRVHPTARSEGIRAFRAAAHDAVVRALG